MNSTSFQDMPWPRVRELVTDALTAGHRKHMAHGMAEVDISRSLAKIEECKAEVPGGVSFTAFLVYCFGHAIEEHKMLHAYRKGRRRLVIFDDVDVNTLLEKRKPDGSMVPVAYIVRGANRKSLAEINHELLRASRGDLYDDAGVRRRRNIMRLPRTLRAMLWWWMARDPARIKQQWGTVTMSNVGSFMAPRPFWGVSIPFMTSTLVVGGRYDRVYWADGRAEPRTALSVTLSVDHDIIDGGPAARFGQTLALLLEGAAGLDDGFVAEATRLSGARHVAAH
jgi:pyruvate/2-oxoglutarate dehydrogenase complex dihydrolipoamide acyltransferase (E2) component